MENPSSSNPKFSPARPPPIKRPRSQWKSFLFGGLLPIIAFTVIEDQYGTIAGIIAGMIFGIGEIIYEFITLRKVSAITWIGNALILALGGLSLISSDGIWFKLQPALFEIFFALFLWVSLLLKKNILVMMAEKQGQQLPTFMHDRMRGVAFRLGLFFIAQAALATWAAFSWTTAQWAMLKGAGVTVSLVVYMVLEMVFMRISLRKYPPKL